MTELEFRKLCEGNPNCDYWCIDCPYFNEYQRSVQELDDDEEMDSDNE